MALQLVPFANAVTFSRGTGATRVNSAGLIVGVDFSTTSNTIATGSKTFTLAADANVNRDWLVGSNVIAVSQAGATGSMTGVVTSYTPSTQALVINVTSVTGSGTSTDWRIGSLDVREDYDPVTLVRKGVLSEVSATNILINSLLNGAVSGTPGTAPTGWTNPALGGSLTSLPGQSAFFGAGSKIQLQASNNRQFLTQTFTLGGFSIFSINVNVIEATQFQQVLGFASAVNVYFEDGVQKQSTDNVSLGSHKLSVFTASTGSFTLRFGVGISNNASGNIIFDLPQLELSSSITSYIPTTTTQVTRNADNFPLTAAAVASIRQGEGTLYAEIDCPDTGVAQKRALRLSGTNADIRIGKQGTGTLSNFTKMAEGGGVQLLGGATQTVQNNGLSYDLINPIDTRNNIATGTFVVNAIAYDGVSEFAGISGTQENKFNANISTVNGIGLGLNQFNGSHYNGSRFLISTGAVGVVCISTDGVSYRRVNTPVITQPTNEVTSGLVGGTLRNVIVGSVGFIATSDDNGETWTSRTSGKNLALTSAAFGLGLFVVSVSESPTSTNIITSPDGITWTSRTTPVANYNDVAFNGSNLFVAVAANGIIISSPDGITWTERFTSAISFRGVHFADGLWVAVGDVGSVVTSPDGLTWTNRTATSGTTTSLQEVNFFNGNFYAVGNGSTLIRNTASAIVAGTAWVSLTAGVSGVLIGIAASPTTLLITGTSGAMASSTDGTTFTSRTNNSQTLNGIAFGNNVFVSVGNAANGSGYIATIGTDGTVTRRVSGTTQPLNNVRFLRGAHYALGNASIVSRSTDGVSWSTQTVGGLGNNYQDAADSGSLIVAVGSSGRVSTSSDGLSFTGNVQNGQTTQQLNGIDYFGGNYVAVGVAGTIITTTNGTTWTLRTSGTTQNLNSVMFSTRDSLWYAAGAAGVLLYSPDAITWTAVQNSGTASILGTTLQSNQPLPQFKSGVNKIALSYKQNQVIAALNGVASTSDTAATIPTITAASIAENLNGYIKRIQIFPNASTAEELAAKTT